MTRIEFMTKEEFEEYYAHNVLHDMAELVLKYGYDKVMEDLAAILDAKVDRLEPVTKEYEL